MRRFSVASLLVAVAMLWGGTAAYAQSLSGLWTANYNKIPIELKLTGSGNTYKGTYTQIFTVIDKKTHKTKVIRNAVNVTATTAVIKNITTVNLTFVLPTKITAPCSLHGTILKCYAPMASKFITFTKHG